MDDHAPKISETPAAPAALAGDPPPAFGLSPIEAGATSSAGPSAVPDAPQVSPPPADALPGDAAPTPLIPLAEVSANPRVTIIRPPAPAPVPTGPRGAAFTFWALIWLAAWIGAMSLMTHRRFERKFDWNTSYFSIAARNLVRDGFARLHGGIYLTAGAVRDDFYAGHPPLTAWLLAGWMNCFGTSDAAIRALPLAFTALNLLLLFGLTRRIFGAPAALAAMIVCSLMPMTIVYGQYVNMEPFVLTFMLGAALGYLGWSRSGSRFGFAFMSICIALGCWTDWPMYIFTGFLAAAHFFHRRDLPASPPGGSQEEPVLPGPPLFASLFMIVLPMAVFAAFLIYLKLNDTSFGALKERAGERMSGGLSQLVEQLKDPLGRRGGHDFVHGLVSLFTPPALLLAALGAIFWAQWSRRLSIAGGEAGRRAAFRILLCIILTQCVYTLVFPEGAVVHEFWQYYFLAPLAVLAAAFCTWLTVVGGMGRKFSLGLLDRAGWAVAASIPFLAVGPVLYRMQIPLMGRAVQSGDERLDANYAGAIAKHTRFGDVILTDWTQGGKDVAAAAKGPSAPRIGLGFALPWYTDRTFIAHDKPDRDTQSLEGIAKIAADKKYAGRRILYLWSGDGPAALEQQLRAKYPRYELGEAEMYLIKGEPDANWRKAGANEGEGAKPTSAPRPAHHAAKPAATPAAGAPKSGTPTPAAGAPKPAAAEKP